MTPPRTIPLTHRQILRSNAVPVLPNTETPAIRLHRNSRKETPRSRSPHNAPPTSHKSVPAHATPHTTYPRNCPPPLSLFAPPPDMPLHPARGAAQMQMHL